MKCKKCGKPMLSCTDNGRPGFYCPEDGSVVTLPMAGPTKAHSACTRVQDRISTTRQPSEGEVSFAEAWRDLYPSLPFETEYKFCLTREFRLDFAWIEAKVAVEWDGYGHGKRQTYAQDITKYNILAYEGWTLFRCMKSLMEKDAERFCRMVAETIRRRQEEDRTVSEMAGIVREYTALMQRAVDKKKRDLMEKAQIVQ